MTKGEAVSFYNKVLLSLTELLKKESNESLNSKINDFKKLVKKGSQVKILDISFKNLKKAALNLHVTEDEQTQEKPKSKFSLKKLIGSEDSASSPKNLEFTYLKIFKDTYQDIINELALELGEDYIKRLVQLSKKIHAADNIDEFDSLRREILSMLQDYIGSVSSERENAAKLISDVVSRLSDVEHYFIESQKFVNETNSANEEFGRNLTKQR